MPTNGIHLVLGISGICPFLAAPSAPPPLSFHPLCLLPCPTGVYRFLTSSFLRIRFACILCLSTIATKKGEFSALCISLCVPVSLSQSVARLRIRNVGLIYQKQHFVLRCVLCLFWQIMQMACKRCLLPSWSSSYTDAFFWFCFSDCAAIVLPALLSATHSLSAFSWLNLRCVSSSSSLSSSSFRHKQLHTKVKSCWHSLFFGGTQLKQTLH